MRTIILNGDCILLNTSSGFLLLPHIWNFGFINSYFIYCPSSHRLPNFFPVTVIKILGWKQLNGESVDFDPSLWLHTFTVRSLRLLVTLFPGYWSREGWMNSHIDCFLFLVQPRATNQRNCTLLLSWVVPAHVIHPSSSQAGLQVCSTSDVRFGQVNN